MQRKASYLRSFQHYLPFIIFHFACNTSALRAGIIAFGTDPNTFNMEFVEIGDPGNTADNSGKPKSAGSVSYIYQIGKYEISEAMIQSYNSNYGTANGLEITASSRGNDKPATSISWNEAARFVNWLNVSKNYSAAYKFDANGVNDNIVLWDSSDDGYDANNPFRNSGANFVLPTVHEWYKAAYYDPNSSSWKQYATLSGNKPDAVTSGTADNTAVYAQSNSQGPADVAEAGGLNTNGVMGITGNVYEWVETTSDFANNSGSDKRLARGGSWSNDNTHLKSSGGQFGVSPNQRGTQRGFRVVSLSSTTATVPEPATSVGVGLVVAIGLLGGRRKRSHSGTSTR